MSRIIKNRKWEEIIKVILEKTNSQNDQQFKKWLEEREHLEYHFDYMLWLHAFGIWKKINKQDNDHFTVVSGVEGSGKSVLALLLAAVVSPTFSMKHICFSIEDFIKIVKTAKRGDSIILDEGAIFLFSRETMSRDNRRVIKAFNLLRQLGYHIIVCIPNFKNLDKDIRQHRADTLLNIRKPKDTYKGITKAGIDVVNDCIKKVNSVNSVKLPHGTFWCGYWSNHYPVVNNINEEEYRKKKKEHLEMFLDELSSEIYSEKPTQTEWVKVSEFEKVVPIKHDAIIRNIQQGKIEGRKIGNLWFIKGDYYRELVQKGGKNHPSSYFTKGEEDGD